MQPLRTGDIDFFRLAVAIKAWGRELGFEHVGITDTDLSEAEAHLCNWLDQGRHGEMGYMARHAVRRGRPRYLVPGTLRVISVRLNYLPAGAGSRAVLQDSERGFISRYALGRDYHRIVRRRLQRLAEKIEITIGGFGYRAFCDSAPVLEKALAEKAGLGWIGKHSNLLHRTAGSWFFLGELYTDLPLPVDAPGANHCGTCRACIDICPTGAIVGPYQIDARRCISYLTIELRKSIPITLRPLIGNRIYGCDDCQLVCPWNRFAQPGPTLPFNPRGGLDAPILTELFAWSEADFLTNTAGSAIRRIGFTGWLRNIAIALGNAATRRSVINALKTRLDHPSELVREHVHWALERHRQKNESK